MNGRMVALAALAVAALALGWGQAAPQSAQAEETGPQMALNVAGAGTSCDAASEPTECAVPAGGDFTLAVEVIEAPEPSYIGVQSYVVYDGLTYNPTASAEDEFAWPDAGGLIVRFPGEPTGTEGFVNHGAATATTPSFPESTHEGSLLELSLTCSEDPQSFEVALISYSSDDVTLGAGFQVDAVTTATLKTVGQRGVDVDGDPATPPELVDVADTLAVRCGHEPLVAAAEPTAPTMPTPTMSIPTMLTPTTRVAASATATAEPTEAADLDDDKDGDGGVGAPLIIGLATAGAAAGAVALGGAAWYVRRRRLK